MQRSRKGGSLWIAIGLGWLALGSIPGVVLGSQWTVRLPERAIRVSLSLVLFFAGLRLAFG